MRAKFIRKAYNENDRYNSPVYEYEYRGKRYFVTEHLNGYSETMKQQHDFEQSRIDEIIAAMTDNIKSDKKEFDINEIFDMLGWD